MRAILKFCGWVTIAILNDIGPSLDPAGIARIMGPAFPT